MILIGSYITSSLSRGNIKLEDHKSNIGDFDGENDNKNLMLHTMKKTHLWNWIRCNHRLL